MYFFYYLRFLPIAVAWLINLLYFSIFIHKHLSEPEFIQFLSHLNFYLCFTKYKPVSVLAKSDFPVAPQEKLGWIPICRNKNELMKHSLKNVAKPTLYMSKNPSCSLLLLWRWISPSSIMVFSSLPEIWQFGQEIFENSHVSRGYKMTILWIIRMLWIHALIKVGLVTFAVCFSTSQQPETIFEERDSRMSLAVEI